jgi:hypothetical protein
MNDAVTSGSARRQRILTLADRPTIRLFGAGIGLVAAVAVFGGITWWVTNGFLAGDTLTYWMAGHRLNVGHALYSFLPDDPWLFGIRGYALYSPPLIAVPWVLLAGMSGNAGMILWWVAMAFCAAWSVSAVLLGTRGWGGLLVLPLTLSLTVLVGIGNVDAAILSGLISAWMLRDHPRALGILVAILVSIKLTPAVLVIWLMATRRWRALAWCAGAGLALAAMTAAVLGPAIFADYLGVIGGVGGSHPAALAVIAAGLVAILFLGRHGRVAFAMAVVLIPFGSPVAAAHTWSLLLAALSPAIQDSRYHRPPAISAA